MKTATVTWITYNNYGTQLQAFALQSYLKELGVENYIISDAKIIEKLCETNLDSNNEDKKCTTLNQKKTNKWPLYLNPLYYYITVKKAIKRRNDNKAKKLYNDTINRIIKFKNTNLSISEDFSHDELFRLNESVDAFICGSDQIWSLLEKNFDSYFFLDFSKKKNISYAASIGANRITKEQIKTLSPLLKKFCKISVREQQTALQLSEELNIPVKWVCDPTLLYDSRFWSEKTNSISIKKNKYVLCYLLQDKEWYFEYASKLAAFLGKQLVLIPSSIDFCYKDISYKKPVGPLEFVKLIKEADFVLTDSYHGTLFSLIFNKQFLYLKRFNDNDKECQNIRIYSIMNYLNLQHLIISEKDFVETDISRIYYNTVNDLLEELRSSSRTFLNEVLFNEQ